LNIWSVAPGAFVNRFKNQSRVSPAVCATILQKELLSYLFNLS